MSQLCRDSDVKILRRQFVGRDEPTDWRLFSGKSKMAPNSGGNQHEPRTVYSGASHCTPAGGIFLLTGAGRPAPGGIVKPPMQRFCFAPHWRFTQSVGGLACTTLRQSADHIRPYVFLA